MNENAGKRILVVDDQASLRFLLQSELQKNGYIVSVAEDGRKGLQKINDDFYDVVLLDIVMPNMDGIALLRAIRQEKIDTEVIVLTGNATVDSAIECMKLGAFEYVQKPYALPELLLVIDRAIERQQSRLNVSLLQKQLQRSGAIDTLTGTSPEIQHVRNVLTRIAPNDSTVLITGESGTGKDVVARAIHSHSHLHKNPFIPLNCATISDNLLESELFGHERGAFTDAKVLKRGIAEVANGGTLFLDEIGEIPLRFQAKLLRFIETGEIRRVGGTKDIQLQVRIVCATNKPLEEMVATGEFRSDLFYRLNVITIHLPPLSARKEDIYPLVQQFLKEQPVKKQFDASAMDALLKHDWPGNIRELKNTVERLCIMSNTPTISASDITFLPGVPTWESAKLPILADTHTTQKPDQQLKTLAELQRSYIVEVLQRVGGHRAKAAAVLGINSKTLYNKMKQYNITTSFR